MLSILREMCERLARAHINYRRFEAVDVVLRKIEPKAAGMLRTTRLQANVHDYVSG